MTAVAQQQREFGDGPLARGAAAVYHTLILEFLLILAASPGLILLIMLVPDRSNIPLAALALVPVGPAVAATVFAWRTVLTQGGLDPARNFWRGYRLNAVGVLRWWIPVLVVLAILGIDLSYLGAVTSADGGGRLVLGLVLIVVMAVVVVVALHAMVLTSLFELRTRDTLRLALYFAGRCPLASLGALSLVVLALGTVVLSSDWVLVMLGSIFALLLLHNARTIIRHTEENFTA